MPRKTDIATKVGRLREFVLREKRMPGYSEMLTLFGYRSKQAVHSLLLKLDELGYITKTGRKIAFTDKLIGNIRLLGTVQAGFPSPAEEELLDTITLDEFLIEKPESTFMLRVTGDSMIDAGIHPGDMVLVERDAPPRKNSIVIAQVDGEWTIKYFVKDRQGVRLDPANSKYEPIRPQNSLEIAGVVRSVIRKY
ncbi:MAG: transcriptional repressor LexA [Kiritimatiellia bacterium]|jgi:repressor LexA|nr:transcriptional repressor LexA [Kiritimatiellia bacterium]MDP6631033.1 transcriptional repressor LexA [Kiritimatiellia bacterium]MDP6809989.1 transcriptional repressor LexA [Kiritimatiellia bacterium]MDP7024760.1 transcriptional repressor LexA [Kiritimatiellia bacterium]